jgi:hypothetical protein
VARDGLWINVDEARSYGSQINDGVGAINGLLSQIGGVLDNTYWVGEDREHFEQDFHGGLKPEAAKATQGLTDTANEFIRRANAQEQLSNGG